MSGDTAEKGESTITGEKGESTITGSYFRLNKNILNDFDRKTKDSSIKSQPGQSTREVIMEKLIKAYGKKGDFIFEIIK